MKRLNKWLLPLLAVLLLLGAALLPPWISSLRDGALYAAHPETLESVSVPLTAPELPARIELLSRWLEDRDSVIYASQEIAGSDMAAGSGLTAQELYDRELQGLTEYGVIPDGSVTATFWEAGTASFTQLYLRGDRVNVEYLMVQVVSSKPDALLELVIDEESGLTVAFFAAHPSLSQYGEDALFLGTALVERLGLDYRVQDEGSFARIRLSGSYVEYTASSSGTLQILPRDEWAEP